MKLLKLKQGTPQWFQARLGKPTASQFHKILTPVKGERSRQDRKYLYMLVMEKLFNQPMIAFPTTEYMEDGKANEPHAASAFAIDQDVRLEELGFVTTDDDRIGASPDRIFADDRTQIAEFKCPSFAVYLRRLLEPGTEFVVHHRPQLQGQLYVGEFAKVHLVAYADSQPLVHVEVGRDDKYIENLATALGEFTEEVDFKVAEAKRRGVLIVPEPMRTPLEHHYVEAAGPDLVIQE